MCMVYGASWLLQFLSLLILANLDKSSHLCWAGFAPRAQAMFASLQCGIHPIQLTLLDVFTFPHSLPSLVLPTIHQEPSSAGANTVAGLQTPAAAVDTQLRVLLDECLSDVRKPGKFTGGIPESGGSLPHSPLASARHWRGQCRWEEELRPVPFGHNGRHLAQLCKLLVQSGGP